MTRATVGLAMLAKLDANSFLAKLTANSLPTRAQIVAWAADAGLTIDAKKIFVRNDVLRLTATAGDATFKPIPGYIQAMKDTSPEYIFAEAGDTVTYIQAGLRCSGTLKEFTNRGSAIIANDASNDLDDVPLAAFHEVTGHKVEAAAVAADPQAALKAQLGL